MRLGQSGTSSTSGGMELFPMICAQEIIFVVLKSSLLSVYEINELENLLY